MKFPDHILLDKFTQNPYKLSQYWIFKYCLNFKKKSFKKFNNNYKNIIFINCNYLHSFLQSHFKNKNNLFTLFDINFLKKDKIYTKLKYSRVPQYDIVSGGVAAIFAGFLGFLICEKFGFELLDSGDFYFLFMYLVFFFFFIKLIFKITNNKIFSWNIISLKWLLHFYQTLFSLFLLKIKKIILNFI